MQSIRIHFFCSHRRSGIFRHRQHVFSRREKSELTKGKLAELSGLCESYMGAIRARGEAFIRIANELKISFDKLLSKDDISSF